MGVVCPGLCYIIAYLYRRYDRLLEGLLLVGLFMQGVMFQWYLGNKSLLLKEGLPLFHCRIAAIMMCLGYFLKQKKITRYFAWLGLIGAITAFSVPDPSPYLWPHLTNITYVGNHLILVMTAIMIISREEERITLKESFLITFVMNIILEMVNLCPECNYGYLSSLPSAVPIHLTKLLLFIIMTLLISLVIAGIDHFRDTIRQNHIIWNS